MSKLALFNHYIPFENTYDEYFPPPQLAIPPLKKVLSFIGQLNLKQLSQLHGQVKEELIKEGITFKVYAKQSASDHLFPFDLFPRIIPAEEWRKIEAGMLQRTHALNEFLQDIYGAQRILKDKRIPAYLIQSCPEYLPQLRGLVPEKRPYINVAGCDLIRDKSGELYILEDNLRIPSGVSYLINNRRMMQKFLPEWMQDIAIHEVNQYPEKLKSTLQSLVREEQKNPSIVVLTPGPYNSAYYEHCFLAQQMGCPLVENHDLFVRNKIVYLRSSKGKKKIDIIYRRTDEQYIDPTFFRQDSLLGVPGLVEAYSCGNVVLANALGNGVADDKAIYHFIPEIIKYYLNEDCILPQVTTYIASDTKDRAYILENLSELVIKVVNSSGGYGMLIGPQASKAQLEEFSQRIMADPRAYIAQPLVQFSTIPSFYKEEVQPHRVDLRIYILVGSKQAWVLPGALTRVALQEGSYIVNSSQGGGSKDTWVIK